MGAAGPEGLGAWERMGATGVVQFAAALWVSLFHQALLKGFHSKVILADLRNRLCVYVLLQI